MVAAIQNSDLPCAVLIIEDDPDDAFLLKRALSSAGEARGQALTIKHSRDGLDGMGSVALSDLRSHLPDVIIVDLNMPVMDGGRFLQLLRNEMEFGEIPTAVLTTSTEKPVHEAALLAGANAVFAKPNTQAELVVIAHQILDMA
jgi:CheY-like chemotaxis protein